MYFNILLSTLWLVVAVQLFTKDEPVSSDYAGFLCIVIVLVFLLQAIQTKNKERGYY